MEAMQSAADKIGEIYKKVNAPDNFLEKWYDVPHLFNIEMQNDAIQFLEKWLKK